MAQFIPVETPGGTILVEVEKADGFEGAVLTSGYADAAKTFEGAVGALKENARRVKEQLEALAPQEVEIEFGIKVGVETGNTVFGLAKASGEGSYTVTLKWKADQAKSE